VFGVASAYDIRYQNERRGDWVWANARKLQDGPVPSEPGTKEVLLIDGLDGSTNYFFGIKTADEVPNWSQLSNVAFAMGGGVDLYLSPDDDVYAGEEMTIYFRSVGHPNISIRIHRWGTIAECLPYGNHPFVWADVVNDTKYNDGIHSVTFDFRYLAPEDGYFPSDWYFVVMCWNFDVRETKAVYFHNDL
jgi:hypothetical protein